MIQDYDYLFKLLIIGSTSVGKSNLLMRFSDNVFSESSIPTIGVDFKIRTFQTNGSRIKLQIWDTAGQEKFKTITHAYYKGAHGVFLVYDITDRQSFNQIENWLAEFNEYGKEDTVKVLIGNKTDLESTRAVRTEEGKDLADSLGIKFFETSAKADINVEKAFTVISNDMKEKVQKRPPTHVVGPPVVVKKKEYKNKDGPCC